MDEFDFITGRDKGGPVYLLCVKGATALGIALGAASLHPAGPFAGAAAGLALGLIACPHLEEPLKKKLFSEAGGLSDQELSQTLHAVRLETGVQSKSDAMYLLATARAAHLAGGGAPPTDPMATRSPRVCAEFLLRNRQTG